MVERGDYISAGIVRHLTAFWPRNPREDFQWPRGPIHRSLPEMVVTRIAPIDPMSPWRYVTCGAWRVETDGPRVELFLSSPMADDAHVETLSMVANYHADPRFRVGPGRVIEIGRPWVDGATCDHLLVSLPYLLGPAFEYLNVLDLSIRFLWLLPVTRAEATYARTHGVEALERVFERAQIDTLDPLRASAV